MITKENLNLKDARIMPNWKKEDRAESLIYSSKMDNHADHLKYEGWIHDAIVYLQKRSQETQGRPLSEEAIFYGAKLANLESRLTEFDESYMQKQACGLDQKDLKKTTKKAGKIIGQIYKDAMAISSDNDRRDIFLLRDVLMVRNILTTDHMVAFMGDSIAAHVQKRIFKRETYLSEKSQHPKALCYQQ